jgi:queuine/archaeosine tRNA-ribosyltransferase
MRYAAAACITLVAGTFVYLNQQSVETPNFDAIPDQEIVSYLQTNIDESDTELLLKNTETLHLEEENISTQELENYINQTL